HAAAYYGKVEILKFLLAQGIPVDHPAPNSIHDTALAMAASNRQYDAVRFLAQAGADVNRRLCPTLTILVSAVIREDVRMVKSLLELGALPELANPAPTPLVMAAYHGYIGVAEVLLQAGANVNTPDVVGTTALAMANRHGHVKMAEFLRQRGGQERRQ